MQHNCMAFLMRKLSFTPNLGKPDTHINQCRLENKTLKQIKLLQLLVC